MYYAPTRRCRTSANSDPRGAHCAPSTCRVGSRAQRATHASRLASVPPCASANLRGPRAFGCSRLSRGPTLGPSWLEHARHTLPFVSPSPLRACMGAGGTVRLRARRRPPPNPSRRTLVTEACGRARTCASRAAGGNGAYSLSSYSESGGMVSLRPLRLRAAVMISMTLSSLNGSAIIVSQ